MMPPRSSRRPRCAYREGGRQCPRDGEGNPPLCKAHRLVLSEVGRSDTPGQRILNVLDTFLRGGRISEAQVAGAINDAAAWVIGGGVAGGFYPNVGGPARPEDYRRGRPPPPPPDPVDHDLLRERARARQALGFTANEVLTADQVKDRQRKLARQTHPDRFPDGPKRQAAGERMIQINVAVEILMEEMAPKG